MLQVRGMRFQRKCSGGTAQLRILEGAFIAKMHFVGSNASFSLMFLSHIA